MSMPRALCHIPWINPEHVWGVWAHCAARCTIVIWERNCHELVYIVCNTVCVDGVCQAIHLNAKTAGFPANHLNQKSFNVPQMGKFVGHSSNRILQKQRHCCTVTRWSIVFTLALSPLMVEADRCISRATVLTVFSAASLHIILHVFFYSVFYGVYIHGYAKLRRA